jgi:selenophosphate synthase
MGPKLSAMNYNPRKLKYAYLTGVTMFTDVTGFIM